MSEPIAWGSIWSPWKQTGSSRQELAWAGCGWDKSLSGFVYRKPNEFCGWSFLTSVLKWGKPIPPHEPMQIPQSHQAFCHPHRAHWGVPICPLSTWPMGQVASHIRHSFVCVTIHATLLVSEPWIRKAGTSLLPPRGADLPASVQCIPVCPLIRLFN